MKKKKIKERQSSDVSIKMIDASETILITLLCVIWAISPQLKYIIK